MLTVLEWWEIYEEMYGEYFTFEVWRGDKMLARYDGHDSVPKKYNNMPVHELSEPTFDEDGTLVWSRIVCAQI